MIIWDEIEYGKKVFETSKVHTRKWQYKELKALAYYLLEEGRTSKEICQCMEKSCSDEIRYLTLVQKTNIFKRIISQCRNTPAIHRISVLIFKEELATIRNAGCPEGERLLFVMLVYKKWLDSIKERREKKSAATFDWFSLMKSDLFKQAGLNVNSKKKQKLIHELILKGLLESEIRRLSSKEKRVERIEKKQMWYLPWLKKEGKEGLFIYNYSNLIFHYLALNDTSYTLCSNCGSMMKRTGSNQKFCSVCRKLKQNERQRKAMKRLRASECYQ